MYSKIMRQICESRPWGKKVVFRSLKWLLCQEVQLPMAEFLESISIDTNAEGTTIEVSKTDVLYICHNFVVHDKSTQHTQIRSSVRARVSEITSRFFSLRGTVLCSGDMSFCLSQDKFWVHGYHLDGGECILWSG